MRSVTRFVPVNWRERKMENGTTGLVMRRSTAMNSAKATTPAPSVPSTAADVQPRSGPSTSPYDTPTSAATTSPLPNVSIRPAASGFADSGT